MSLWQGIPLVRVDEEVQRRAALPPAGIVIVFGNLEEAELLVIIGSDPFGRVDGALFEGGVDIAARDVLRNGAELGKGLAGPSADPEFEAIEVVDGVNFLADPAAHLGAGIAAGDSVCFVLLAELVEHVLTAVILKPGILLARVQTERNGAIEREGRVLADEVIGGGVTHLDRAIAHRVERLQGWNDLAAGESLNLKLVVGGFRDIFRDRLRCTEGNVERLRPARGTAPFQLWHRLRIGRRTNGPGCT